SWGVCLMAEASARVLVANALAGKTALVTGAARGIGRAIALELAHTGANVAINDLERADETVQAITALGRHASYHRADVSQRAEVEAMIAAVVAEHGRLDILVNNAGISFPEPFLDITDRAMQRTLDVDLKGVILCGQVAARQMVRQGAGGRIVNISSVHAVSSWAGAVVYDAAKAGVMRLTATMALELAEHDITVNTIGPGWVDTPINDTLLSTPEQRDAVERSIPLGRVGRPEEIGALAAFLCTDAAAYMTGSFVLMDGGLVISR
ncbi:MAG: short-chain dehydrogenase/reductase, partial [Chloroflexi bacterium]|nr:short-chain dehydrogenase/reductase [Chloroflexota bacterium]